MFRDRQREELAIYLRDHRYLDDREVLDEAALTTRVMGALVDPLRLGHLSRDEVVSRVHELYTLARG